MLPSTQPVIKIIDQITETTNIPQFVQQLNQNVPINNAIVLFKESIVKINKLFNYQFDFEYVDPKQIAKYNSYVERVRVLTQSYHSLTNDFVRDISQIIIHLNAAAEYAFEDATRIMCGVRKYGQYRCLAVLNSLRDIIKDVYAVDLTERELRIIRELVADIHTARPSYKQYMKMLQDIVM